MRLMLQIMRKLAIDLHTTYIEQAFKVMFAWILNPILFPVPGYISRRCIHYLKQLVYLIYGEQVVSVDGVKVIADIRHDVDWLLWMNRFEVEERSLIQEIVRSGMVVMDIGANIGYYSLLFSRLVGNKGTVHSFEPIPETFTRLNRNVMANNVTNIILHNTAIGDLTGTAAINVSSDLGYSTFGSPVNFKDINNTIDVSVITIDDYVVSNRLNRIDLIKVDVEGFELPAFRGMINTLLSENAPLIIVEYNREAQLNCGFTPDEMPVFLEACGYTLFGFANGKFHTFVTSPVPAYDELLAMKTNHMRYYFKDESTMPPSAWLSLKDSNMGHEDSSCGNNRD